MRAVLSSADRRWNTDRPSLVLSAEKALSTLSSILYLSPHPPPFFPLPPSKDSLPRVVSGFGESATAGDVWESLRPVSLREIRLLQRSQSCCSWFEIDHRTDELAVLPLDRLDGRRRMARRVLVRGRRSFVRRAPSTAFHRSSALNRSLQPSTSTSSCPDSCRALSSDRSVIVLHALTLSNALGRVLLRPSLATVSRSASLRSFRVRLASRSFVRSQHVADQSWR